MAKKKALGRGLGALIDDAKYTKRPVKEAISTSAIAEIDITKIKANPYQPRTEFDLEKIDDLAKSIKELGIIQPITVRKLSEDNFELISGERRLKASKIAGLKTIISFVRDANDVEMLEMSLVENVQREDLNPIEISLSYQRLINECKLTQEKLSSRIGQNRSTIANYLRLLKLPAEVQVGIRDKQITMGHAKAIVKINDPNIQVNTFFKVVNDGLSVRNTEEIVRKVNYPVGTKFKTKKQTLQDEHIEFKNKLGKKLDTKIDFKRNVNGRGSVSISFKSDEELKKLMDYLIKGSFKN